MDNERKYSLELLAPVGGRAQLDAALNSGADAVYFGLGELNARRSAENFSQKNLADAVAKTHAAGAKAYLTLNTDISQRELGHALRHLELARQAGIDAVIVKDPALLFCKSFFPELKFHLSTQAGISNSAGMKAAEELGLSRVVLGREMSLSEIRKASSASNVETEIFVQGAMCFSVSGRCLISSWCGGRSGNRGLCASPCRFEWENKNDKRIGRFFSMHDLSLASHIAKIADAGVKSLKIEGRMKNAGWVGTAVSFFRKALAGALPSSSGSELSSLGDYTGRKFSDSYFSGSKKGLTGESGRVAQTSPECPGEEPDAGCKVDFYNINLEVRENKLCWHVICNDSTLELVTPLRNSQENLRTMQFSEVMESLNSGKIQNLSLRNFKFPESEHVISKSDFRKFTDSLSSFLHRAMKPADKTVRVELSQDLKSLLLISERSSRNNRSLGSMPNIVRLSDMRHVCEFRKKYPKIKIILDNPDVKKLEEIRKFANFADSFIPALPTVFYEDDIPGIEKIVSFCCENKLHLEVNGWDGWFLAKSAGVKIHGGPGLMILNSLAAKFLSGKGFESACISIEADSEKIEDLCASSELPLTLYVYGRPPLFFSRVKLPSELMKAEAIFEDSRMIRIKAFTEGGLTVFRPVDSFNIMLERNPKIKIANIAADLASSLDLTEFESMGKAVQPFLFNFNRELK